jgi:aldose 1-epimerase
MNDSARLTLSNGVLEAEIAPHLGARLCSLRALDGISDGIDLVVPLHEWDAPAHGWPKAGAYPLIPYSNRIANARLEFEGRSHALAPHPLDLPNTLHGHAQRCAWHTRIHHSQRAELELDAPACEHWPWSFDARIVFELDTCALNVHFTLRNTSASTMPAGLGWHPFLAVDAASTIHFDARRRWELDETFLPTGRALTLDAPTTLRRDDWQTQPCAIYVSEWNGEAHIERDAGTVRLTAKAPFTHLVAYTPREGTFFCLEPVSHVANGFNFAARGIDGTGLHTLAPGASLTARATLAWESKR